MNEKDFKTEWYEAQTLAARYKAERDIARQEVSRMKPSYDWVQEQGGLQQLRLDYCCEKGFGDVVQEIAEIVDHWKGGFDSDSARDLLLPDIRVLKEVYDKMKDNDLYKEYAKMLDSLNSIIDQNKGDTQAFERGYAASETFKIMVEELNKRLMPPGYEWSEFKSNKDESNLSLNEWLKSIEKICFENLESCDQPEYSLFSTILSVIYRYKRNDSDYTLCNPFANKGCPLLKNCLFEEVDNDNE